MPGKIEGLRRRSETYAAQWSEILTPQTALFRKIGGEWWIRTTEGVSQQIYSLSHLATLETPREDQGS